MINRESISVIDVSSDIFQINAIWNGPGWNASFVIFLCGCAVSFAKVIP